MNSAKLIGIIVIVAGCLGLVYGSFSYTRESTAVKVGPVELKVQENKTINIPLIVSVGAIAVGIFMIVGIGRK